MTLRGQDVNLIESGFDLGEFGCFTQMCECSLNLVFAYVDTLCKAV